MEGVSWVNNRASSGTGLFPRLQGSKSDPKNPEDSAGVLLLPQNARACLGLVEP